MHWDHLKLLSDLIKVLPYKTLACFPHSYLKKATLVTHVTQFYLRINSDRFPSPPHPRRTWKSCSGTTPYQAVVSKSKRLLVPTGVNSWHLKISHSKSHGVQRHTGSRRPLEFKMEWKASGLPSCLLSDLAGFQAGQTSLDISTAKGLAGTYHCNRSLASVWLEKHFYFISRDASRMVLFLLSVS